MGGLPQAQYSVHSCAYPSAIGIKYDPLQYGLKPGKYRVKHFGHSTQWRTREAMACVGELLRGLFPSAPVVKQSGSRRYWRDPCCTAQPPALRPRSSIGLECMGAETAKIPSIARLGSVRIRATSVCQHSRAK